MNRVKCIWVINQFAGTPESGWGERHFYFAKYWIQMGYEVKVISSSFNHMFRVTKEVKGLFMQETIDGIDFYWVRTPKYKAESILRFLSMLFYTWRVMRLPVKKIGIPDAVIVSSMPIFPIYAGLRLKKLFNAKVIFEIRDIWPLTLQLLGNKSKNHPAVRFIGWFEKVGYRKSDHVVSLLPNAIGHMKEVATRDISFHYIPNGIDENLLKSEALPIDKSIKIPEGKFIVGYAGTIGLANALEFLIDASIALKDDQSIHFVVVGDGYLKGELEQKVKGNENITFLDKIPKNQVQDLLTFFDVCFVGRNDTELFRHGVSANKYFDYMLAGKPILDSNNPIKDPVELSGCGVIVKPDSAKAITEGIQKLKSMSASELETMGQKGRTYVLKEHNIGNLAKKYTELF